MGSEGIKTKVSNPLWVATTLILMGLLIVAFCIYIAAPNKVRFSVSAGDMPDGSKKVSFRATSADSRRDVLYTTDISAKVSSGSLTLDFDTPNELKGKSYIAEVCVTDDSSGESKCFSQDTDKRVAANYSCPYLVNQHKSSKIANLTGANEVNLDNSVACQGDFAASTKGELSPNSRVDVLKSLENQVLSMGDGLLMAKDGKLSVVSKDELVEKASHDKEIIEKVVTINQHSHSHVTNMTQPQYNHVTNITQPQHNHITNITQVTKDPQQLSLNGNVLSLSDGGDVTLTDNDTTYGAGDGLVLDGETFKLAQQGATNGQVLMWDAAQNKWLPKTPASFTDTDDQTLSYNESTHALTIDGGNTVTFPLASGSKDGLLSKEDWNTFSGKENVLTFSGGLVRSGDNVQLMNCAAGKILQKGTTGWLCADQVVDTNNTYSAGQGIAINNSGKIDNTGVLAVNGDGAIVVDNTDSQNPAIKLNTSADLEQVAGSLGLKNTGVNPGTYNNVTVDNKGRVTAGTNISYLTSEQDAIVGNEVAGVVNNGGLVMTGAGTTADPYKVGLITTCSDGQLLKYSAANGWACANDIDTNTDTNTDNQTLSYNPANNQLTIARGNTVDLSNLNNVDTDQQRVSLNGNTLALERGGSVDLSKYLDNTDNQALSLNTTAGTGDVKNTYTLSLTNGGNVTLQDTDTKYTAGNGLSLAGNVFGINAPTCTATQKLTWDGSSFQCAEDIDTDTDTNTDNQTLSITGTAGSGNVTKDYRISLLNGGSVAFQDTDTKYTAGEGITLDGTEFSVKCDGANGKILCQNGNSFGGEAVVGTNDTFGISFETNGTKKLSIDTDGNLLLPAKTVATSDINAGGSAGSENKYTATGSISSRKPVIMRQYVWPRGTQNDWMTIRTGVSTDDYAVAMVGGYAFKFSSGVIKGMGLWTEKGSDGTWKIKGDVDGVNDQWSLVQVAFFRSEISSHDTMKYTFNIHDSTRDADKDHPTGGYPSSTTPTPVQ